MSEIAKNILENLPYYAGAAGAVVGAGYDYLTQRTLAAERPAGSEAVADAAENLGHPTWLKKAIGATGTALIFGMAAGGAGTAWAEHQPPTNDKAELVVVSDRAGSTLGDESAAITSDIHKIGSYRNIDAQAVSAWNGIQPVNSLPNAASIMHFGRADMHGAVLGALDALKVQQQKSANGKSAMIVLTADSLGSSEDIISESKALASPVPITVVNYDKKASDKEVASEAAIAKQTGGQFLNNPSNADFDKTIDGLAPPEAEPVNETPDAEKWFITAIAAAGIFAFSRKRRHLPLTLNGLGNRLDRSK